ncbi:uncharacterized protein LOC144293845 [Canis aureus]
MGINVRYYYQEKRECVLSDQRHQCPLPLMSTRSDLTCYSTGTESICCPATESLPWQNALIAMACGSQLNLHFFKVAFLINSHTSQVSLLKSQAKSTNMKKL